MHIPHHLRHTAPAFFHAPYTPRSLRAIARSLAAPFAPAPPAGTQSDVTLADADDEQRKAWSPVPPRRRGSKGEAAVLIPLINVRGEDGRMGAGTLFQLRPGGMRMHGGEVSFPGGKCDPTDASLYDTALREAHEELGIHPQQVEYVGRLKLRARQEGEAAQGEGEGGEWDDGPIKSLGGLMVWAFVGFVHPPRSRSASGEGTASISSADTALPALPLDTLRLSPQEVTHVIPLPSAHVLPGPSGSSETHDRAHLVRRRLRKQVTSDRIGPGSTSAVLGGEYLAIAGVGPLAVDPGASSGTATSPALDLTDLEIWGLTAWIINVLWVRLGLMDAVERAVEAGESERDEDLVRRLREEREREQAGTGGGAKL